MSDKNTTFEITYGWLLVEFIDREGEVSYDDEITLTRDKILCDPATMSKDLNDGFSSDLELLKTYADEEKDREKNRCKILDHVSRMKFIKSTPAGNLYEFTIPTKLYEKHSDDLASEFSDGFLSGHSDYYIDDGNIIVGNDTFKAFRYVLGFMDLAKIRHENGKRVRDLNIKM